MSFRGETQKKHLRRLKISPRGGVTAVALFCLTVSAAAPVAAGVWRMTPRLEIAETYTDNVDLDAVRRQSDFITRISPGVSVVGAGARLNMNVDYAANFLIFARSDEDTDLRHQLNGFLNSELSEDLLFIDVRASVNQQFLDRGGALTSNDANVTDNRRTVQSYSASPYLRHRIGTFATATARYRVSYVDVQRPRDPANAPVDLLGETVTHQGRLSLDSGARFTRLRWNVYADHTYYDRTGGRRNSERSTVVLDARYSLNRWLSLDGSIGYEKLNDTTITRRPEGAIWNVGATLTPGPRTRLSVRGGRRYGRDNWSVDGSYRISDRTLFSIRYTEEITTSLNILQDELIDFPEQPAVDPVDGSLVDASFLLRRASATLSGSRGRNTFSIRGFYDERRQDVGRPGEDNYGGSLSFDRQLSPYTSGYISGRYQHTQFRSVDGREDDYYSVQTGLNYTLSRYISGGLTYFFTYRESSVPGRNVKENAVRLSVRATF